MWYGATKCAYNVTKCAGLVRQNVRMCAENVVGIVRPNVQVRCVNVCRYNAKCRNGAMECGNVVTEWRRNDDHHEQRQINKIELCLRTVVFLF